MSIEREVNKLVELVEAHQGMKLSDAVSHTSLFAVNRAIDQCLIEQERFSDDGGRTEFTMLLPRRGRNSHEQAV